MALDTLSQRYEKLLPHIQVYGPEDGMRRPAVLLFHGCGGIASNLMSHAAVAVRLGVRAFVIDSFSPRGWSRKYAGRMVCTGLQLRGFERSGDVLAALWGLAQRPDVDPEQIVLAGWSHGAWAMMDLMTQPLHRPGEARLHDPSPAPLKSVTGMFLAYPYINVLARTANRPWLYKPNVFAILTLKDHLASYNQSVEIVRRLRAQEIDVKTLTLSATHAFDEIGIDRTGIMAYDEAGLLSSLDAFEGFLAANLRFRADA